jgi:esterase/lipase
MAQYFQGITPNSKLLIWAGWMPVLPDDKDISVWYSCLAWGWDVLCPEYYGFGRSDGMFTPEACVQTLIESKKMFLWGQVRDVNTQQDIIVHYETIVFVGFSFGWFFVPRLPKEILWDRICLICPALSFATMGKIGYPEESYEQAQLFVHEGFAKHQYRGYDDATWREFHHDKRGMSLDQTITHLQNVNVFVAHGWVDSCIHVSRSREFVKKLNPNHTMYLELANSNHGSSLRAPTMPEMIKRLNW